MVCLFLPWIIIQGLLLCSHAALFFSDTRIAISSSFVSEFLTSSHVCRDFCFVKYHSVLPYHIGILVELYCLDSPSEGNAKNLTRPSLCFRVYFQSKRKILQSQRATSMFYATRPSPLINMAEGLVPQQQLVSLRKRPRHCDHSKEVDDIVVEILSRLPVKSLLRFRSVCKSWRALISDSYFVKKHLGHAFTDTSNSFRLVFLNARPRTVDLQGLEVHDHIRQQDSFAEDILGRSRILGSCNGLICLQEMMFDGIYRDDIFIWNPSIRATKKVPKHKFTKGSRRFYGFGYDANTEDYKLIVGDSNHLAEETKFGIFTLKTGSWRTVEDFQFVNLDGQGCFANGALHWLDSKYYFTRIISFDLAKEKCEQLCRIVCGTLMFTMGIGSISSIRSMPMTIWVMSEYGKDKPWTKLMNIPTNIVPYKVSLTPKQILENGEVLMILDEKECVVYNPKENKYRTVFQTSAIFRRSPVVLY